VQRKFGYKSGFAGCPQCSKAEHEREELKRKVAFQEVGLEYFPMFPPMN